MKRTKITILVTATLAVLAFGTASAQDKPQGSGPSPFVDCGIGAALFPDTHWAAVTSNIIWDIGTTAVISATASPETCNGKSAKAARFINDTYDNVLEDTARGSGEYVAALLEIYGCEASSQGDIVGAIRGDIGEMLSDEGYSDLTSVEKAEQYFLVIDGEVRGSSAASCAV